ncbi:MAG: hypothetical protein CVU06_14190, partial [Bacteroidetes bacterium HGW-Bacteroidetes-22]
MTVRNLGILTVLFAFMQGAFAQDVPELIYYKFDAAGATVENFASAPVGTNPAPVTGLTIGGTGQFGTALQGNGGASSSNIINTGWVTNLGTGHWTISLYLNGLVSNTTLYYLFGDAGANSFRCFLGGAAGAGNLLLRGGGLPDLVVPSVATGPTVVHFTYDGTAIKAYKNGVLSVSANASAAAIAGTGFTLGGYSTSTGMNAGSVLDEFRVYNRALDAAEVAATWNVELGGGSSTTPVTVTIGTGTTSCGYPYYTLYEDARTQILVTKAEIEAAGGFAGMIDNLELSVISANSITMNGFEIRMQNYSGSTPAGFINTDWTTVYAGTDVATVGWHNTDFMVPFMWDGTSNLLFQICYDNTGWNGNSTVNGTAASGMTWHQHDDGASGCGFAGGSTYATRPNLRFEITPMSGAVLEGIVTNATSGLPVIGAKVMVGDSLTYTLLDGSYSLLCKGTDVIVKVSKIGFDNNDVPFT